MISLSTHFYNDRISLSKGEMNTYSMGGHYNEETKMLEARFNDPSDIIKEGYLKNGGFKSQTIIDTPTGMTNSGFVQNILNEYKQASLEPKKYHLLSAMDSFDDGGNCNNFSATIISRACGGDMKTMDRISGINPFGLNPGMGESFSRNFGLTSGKGSLIY